MYKSGDVVNVGDYVIWNEQGIYYGIVKKLYGGGKLGILWHDKKNIMLHDYSIYLSSLTDPKDIHKAKLYLNKNNC